MKSNYIQFILIVVSALITIYGINHLIIKFSKDDIVIFPYLILTTLLCVIIGGRFLYLKKKTVGWALITVGIINVVLFLLLLEGVTKLFIG